MKNSTQSLKTFSCPNCGSNVAVRAAGHTLNVFCDSCHAQIDPNDSTFQTIEFYHNELYNANVYLPIGAKGKLENKIWEVIGFRVLGDDEGYNWREYLLFNPYFGFRFLTEASGHWTLYQKTFDKPEKYLKYRNRKTNYEKSVQNMPAQLNRALNVAEKFAEKQISALFEKFFENFQGKTYELFNVAETWTVYAAGEFYWRVQIEEPFSLLEAIAPPYALALEIEGEEISVSTGVYLSSETVQAAFQLNIPPPAPEGIAPAQPTAISKAMPVVKRIWQGVLVLYLGLQINYCTRAKEERVLQSPFTFKGNDIPTLISPPFQLSGAPANLELNLNASELYNSWMALEVTLVNAQTGESRFFTQEIEYYTGNDEEGAWTEGSQSISNVLPNVPDGKYYLVFDPIIPSDTSSQNRTHHFGYVVVRDVPPGDPKSFFFYGAPIILMMLVPYYYFRFIEKKRWAHSNQENRYKVNNTWNLIAALTGLDIIIGVFRFFGSDDDE